MLNGNGRGMKTLYLAQMKWCEREEPIACGYNRKELQRHALAKLHAKHGKGSVDRGAAMCSLPITASDIAITPIEMIESH